MGSGTAEASLFAITAPGLEELAAAELRALGIHGAAEEGGVAWTGTLEQMQAVNLHARTVSRVLLRIAEFRAQAFYELEKRAGRVPWERFVAPGRAVRWRVTCRKSRLYHQGAVEQRFREAVERRVGAVSAEAEADEEQEGATAQLFVVRFVHDRCTVSADTSGALLYQRGYRQALARAPLRETLAAALLLAGRWPAEAPLLDPMCGSGTIPIEAALLARRVAPGLAHPGGSPRPYAFQQWPEHDDAGWSALIDRARERILPSAPAPILGSDRDAGAVEAATANATRAGVLGDLTLSTRTISAIEPPAGHGWLVTNPPYGVRVGEGRDLRNLYAAIGRVARARLAGWQMVMLSADPRLEAQLAIPLEPAIRTRNGGIPVRVMVGRVPAY